MQAQRYRHRVTIQRQVETQNPVTLAVSVIWQDRYTDVPAEVLTGAGREAVAAGTTIATTDARINFRWLPDIDQKDRVVYGGRFYNITGIDTDRTGVREIRLRCEEGATGGM